MYRKLITTFRFDRFSGVMALLLASAGVSHAAMCTDHIPAPVTNTTMTVAPGQSAAYDIFVSNKYSQRLRIATVVDVITASGTQVEHLAGPNLWYNPGQTRQVTLQGNAPSAGTTQYYANVSTYDISGCQRSNKKGPYFSITTPAKTCGENQRCAF